MKANEFTKKGFLSTKYALGVSMAIEGEKTITSEFRLAKEAILQWFEDRGKAADMIMFTVLAPDEQHAEIEAFFRRVAEQEVQLAPIFKRVSGELNLMNLAGKGKRKVTLT